MNDENTLNGLLDTFLDSAEEKGLLVKGEEGSFAALVARTLADKLQVEFVGNYFSAVSNDPLRLKHNVALVGKETTTINPILAAAEVTSYVIAKLRDHKQEEQDTP